MNCSGHYEGVLENAVVASDRMSVAAAAILLAFDLGMGKSCDWIAF